MDERTSRVIARAVVERAGNDVNLLRPRVMNVELQELCAGVDLEDLSLGTIRPLPQRAFAHAWIELACGNVSLIDVNDLGHPRIVSISLAAIICSPKITLRPYAQSVDPRMKTTPRERYRCNQRTTESKVNIRAIRQRRIEAKVR